MIPLRSALSAACVALCLGLGLPTAASAAPALGVSVVRPGDAPPAFVATELDAARRARATLVRTEVLWEKLEPAAPGVVDPAYLAQVDEMVAGAAARGMKVLMLLNGSPCWASSAPAAVRGDCGPGVDPEGFASHPPADVAQFGRVAGFLAARYGAGNIAAIEVWNEPDHENEIYFKGPDKPARYAALLKAAYGPIKQAAPGIQVLGGALVGANGVFLRELYRNGIKGHYDGLSVHFYDLVLASLRSIREVQRAHGDTKPLWLGEFGWTSCRPRASRQGGHACVTRARQAQNTVDVLRALRRTSYVRGAVVFAMHDNAQYDFGLLTRDSRAKPVLGAIRSHVGRPRATRRPTLSLRVSRGRVVARGSAPAGDALGIEVRKDGRLRYRASFRLDRDNRYSLRLPKALGTRGLRVRVEQFWTGRTATRRR